MTDIEDPTFLWVSGLCVGMLLAGVGYQAFGLPETDAGWYASAAVAIVLLTYFSNRQVGWITVERGSDD